MSKIIVITGATSGLGNGLVEEFVSRGHIVAGCGRNAEVIEHLNQQYSGHDFSVVDVSDLDQVSGWASRVESRIGVPDLLINNAAIINQNAPLWLVPPTEFTQVMEINVIGVFNVIRCFIPSMLKRQNGVIVNLSSGWGRSTSPEVGPYCASKWAIEGLTQSLAQELPAGMAAIPVNPGVIHTKMLESCFGESAEHYPGPKTWAETAAPFLIGLGSNQNGEALTVPH